jgi:hypothetical protein
MHAAVISKPKTLQQILAAAQLTPEELRGLL